MINSTLCYLERGDDYLMLHRVKKKDDLNHDKWIGVGGKFEERESPEDCILRETWEETGLTLTDYRYRGLVTFVSDEAPTEYMHLFTATGWTGTPHPCDEGELAWIKKAELRCLPMWEGDKIFPAPAGAGRALLLPEAPIPGRPAGRGGAEREADRMTPASDTGAAVPGRSPGGGGPVGRPGGDPMRPISPPPARRRRRQTGWNACWTASGSLPSPTVFALREGAAFRGLAGCPPVDTAAGIYGLFYQLLPACWGRGVGLAAAAEALRRLERLAPALVLADTVAENTASVRILERLGFVRTAVRHRRLLPGGADAGYLGLRPPLGWSGGDRLTGTAPRNMEK